MDLKEDIVSDPKDRTTDIFTIAPWRATRMKSKKNQTYDLCKRSNVRVYWSPRREEEKAR